MLVLSDEDFSHKLHGCTRIITLLNEDFSHRLHGWTRIPAILDEDLSGFRNVAKAKIESANYHPSAKADGNKKNENH